MRKQHKKMPSEKSPLTRPRRQKGVRSTIDSRIEKENLPSLSHIPKHSLDSILHYLLQRIKESKQPPLSSSFAQKRHRYFLFQFYKNFQLKSRLMAYSNQLPFQ
jgi:hypothetical protein